MVATATAGATESVRPRLSPRLPLSLTTATEATVVDMEATADTVLATAGATMASVRLRPSPTMATEGTEATVVDTEAMVDTATAGATTASVRPRPRLSPTTATEATEATEVTVMATASNMFPGSFDESYFAQP